MGSKAQAPFLRSLPPLLSHPFPHAYRGGPSIPARRSLLHRIIKFFLVSFVLMLMVGGYPPYHWSLERFGHLRWFRWESGYGEWRWEMEKERVWPFLSLRPTASRRQSS
jgi:hypothetical protein